MLTLVPYILSKTYDIDDGFMSLALSISLLIIILFWVSVLICTIAGWIFCAFLHLRLFSAMFLFLDYAGSWNWVLLYRQILHYVIWQVLLVSLIWNWALLTFFPLFQFTLEPIALFLLLVVTTTSISGCTAVLPIDNLLRTMTQQIETNID